MENISVIVPVYKVESYLARCSDSILEAVKNLRSASCEIIFVDDGSPDRCPGMCDEYALKYNDIKVIHQANGGLSAARNSGIETASGDGLTFIDSDDWVEPNMFQVMFNEMVKTDADCCVCGICIENELNGSISDNCSEYFFCTKIEALERLYDETKLPVSSWCKLYKSWLWSDIRFPKGKHYEDAFTTYKVLDKCRFVVQIPDALYHYRIRKNSIMTNTIFSLKLLEECEAWEENFRFVKSKYRKVSPKARFFWLEHIVTTLKKFPPDSTGNVLAAKKTLKKKIFCNLIMVFLELGLKKTVSLLNCMRGIHEN